MNPSELVKELAKGAPAAKPTHTFYGWDLNLNVSTATFNMSTVAKYGKVETEPLVSLEGDLVKVGPRGLPVKGKWRMEYTEGEGADAKQIDEGEIRTLQVQPDGSKVEVDKLPRTSTIDVAERQLEECTLEDNKAYGCLLPIEQTREYVVESTYELWGKETKKESTSAAVKMLAEFLEREKSAILFPFTFGLGWKISTALVYPIRENGDLYLLMCLASGRRILKHSLTRGEIMQTIEKPKLAKPILKVKKIAGVQ